MSTLCAFALVCVPDAGALSAKGLFIDESGDDSLSAIDPQYPIFVLGGVIVDYAYAEGEMNVLVERFCFEIGSRQRSGLIVAEKRGPVLDRQLNLAWMNLRSRGTNYLRAKVVSDRIVGLVSRRKQDDVAGLQVADLVVSPIGRFVLGLPANEDFRAVESKFRRDSSGRYRGTGLVVLPKE